MLFCVCWLYMDNSNWCTLIDSCKACYNRDKTIFSRMMFSHVQVKFLAFGTKVELLMSLRHVCSWLMLFWMLLLNITPPLWQWEWENNEFLLMLLLKWVGSSAFILLLWLKISFWFRNWEMLVIANLFLMLLISDPPPLWPWEWGNNELLLMLILK